MRFIVKGNNLEDGQILPPPKKNRAICLVGSQQFTSKSFLSDIFFRGHVTLLKKSAQQQKKPTYSSVTSSSTSVCQDNVTGTAGSVLFAYDHDSDCIIPGCEWRSIYRADVRSSSWEYLGSDRSDGSV